jgi:hypothetical protein
MREAERLVEIILEKCQGCLLYTSCSESCVELYEVLKESNINIPLDLITPVSMAQRVKHVVDRWGEYIK